MSEQTTRQDISWYFEDFRVGDVFHSITRTPTEWDVMGFVTLGGFFEEIWLNARKPEAETLNRSRLVPGPLTLILAEGLYVLSGRMHHAVALLGVDDVRWSAPVAVGDGISCDVEVVETRRSRSFPDRGVVSTKHLVVNHDDKLVLSYRSARMHLLRPSPTAEG